MRRTLQAIESEQRLELSICVTGMHLHNRFGGTVQEVESGEFRRVFRVPSDLTGGDGSSMAMAIAQVILGLTPSLLAARPDALIVLGDRGEMLASAIASIHLNIPVIHIHGGERSGTVDEPVRHAISKLSHYHFVSTDKSRDRLIRMGEKSGSIHVVGAPGLVGIKNRHSSREELSASFGFDSARPIGIFLFHGLLQSAAEAGAEARLALAASLSSGLQLIVLMPNSDAGTMKVREAINSYEAHTDVRVVTHMERETFLDWMNIADVMVGNSSSGIIEAASVGLRVVNIGGRQRLRERSANVIDVDVDSNAVKNGISASLCSGRFGGHNVYGDGLTDTRIASLLATIDLGPRILEKVNEY